MQNDCETHPSLLDLFTPPDDSRRGVFGLMCALSGDAVFMDSVMSAFTGLTARQRERLGRISMALFLDGSHGQIEDMPGLAWGFPIQGKPKIELMHAKVALLGYGPAAVGKPDYFRLIIFTGNWTTDAVNAQLNIVWYCDYDTTSSQPAKQEAADIYVCLDFWRSLLKLMDNGKGYYLLAQPVSERTTWFIKHIEKVVPKPGETWTARFFSNITGEARKNHGVFTRNSIGAQVIERICRDRKARNFICCGSGFYEKAGRKPEEPEVLRDVVRLLQQKRGGLTANLSGENKYLVINEKTSGAVGHWLKRGEPGDDSWAFCRPYTVENPGASLHAKYLFIANWVFKTERYASGLIYIGSANISKQGFALGPGTGGNVEAGVFFSLEECPSEEELCTMLGIADEEVDPSDILDKTDDEETEKGTMGLPPPPPIHYLVWDHEGKTLRIPQIDENECWKIISIGGKSVSAGLNVVRLDKECPGFSVELVAQRNGRKQTWRVPVFVEHGTFCTPAPVPKTAHELLASVVDFPDSLPEDDDPDSGDRPEDPGRLGLRKRGNTAAQVLSEERIRLSEFPLHLATTLVETIAQKNQLISEDMMPDWVAHLRRLLLHELDPVVSQKLRALGIDFLETMRSAAGFASPVTTAEYLGLIDEVRKMWWPVGSGQKEATR
jgi:hypothetical protein